MTVIDGFEERIAPLRGELLAYCYRMVGSAHDAEDLVQDVYLRAWRARESYDERRASLRTWLYRIATNVCLTALETRSRRPLPSGLVAERDPRAPFEPADHAWLQPLPGTVGTAAADPGETVAARAGLRLAFVSACQNLSARERGALILREVLGFSAAETAEVLGGTVAATNSALQRARARMRNTPGGDHAAPEPPAAEQRARVERYLRAFERADVEGIKRLLTDDVIMEMPPMLNWFTGPENYGIFMDWVFAANGTDWRLLPVTANGGQPGFAAYVRDGAAYRLHTLQILTVAEGGIARNSVFLDNAIFAAFSLPATL